MTALAARADRVGYTGHIDDATLELTYMQARYYDPIWGRFLSNDPVGFQEGGVGFHNRYAYTFNDPVNLIDPFGEAPGDTFGSLEEAAEDWAKYVLSEGAVDTDGNQIDIDSVEYGSVISQGVDGDGNTTYSYNTPRRGTTDNAPFGGTSSELDNAVASIHNHNGRNSSKPSSQAQSSGSRIRRSNGTNGTDDHVAHEALSERSKVANERTFTTIIYGRSGYGRRQLRPFRFTSGGEPRAKAWLN